MAIKDNVDVGILAILRGGYLAPPSPHQVLSRTILGTALGTLAIDAMLSDERILQACRVAVEQRNLSLSTMYRDLPAELRGCSPHQDLGYKLIRVAVQELMPNEPAAFLAGCGVMLQQIRVAASNPETRQLVMDAQHAVATAKPRDDG